jgi:hypothetical protein
VNSTVSQVPLPALFEGMRMAIQQPQPKITAKPIEFNRLKQYLTISAYLVVSAEPNRLWFRLFRAI